MHPPLEYIFKNYIQREISFISAHNKGLKQQFFVSINDYNLLLTYTMLVYE